MVEDDLDLVCYSHLWGTAFNAAVDPILIAGIVGIFFLVRRLFVASFIRRVAIFMMFGTESSMKGDKDEQDLNRWIKYAWHMLVYSSFSIYNYYALFINPWGFKMHQMVNWPHPLEESYHFKPFLFLQLCWYIHGLGEMFLWDRHRGDLPMMILHHFLAIYLIFFSWYANMSRLSISVTAVQDVVDVFIYIMKMCHKSANVEGLHSRPVQITLLVSTTTIWWVARVFLMACINYVTWYLVPDTCADHWIPSSLRIQLGINLLLQIIWGAGISKMCLSLILKGSFHDNVHEKNLEKEKKEE